MIQPAAIRDRDYFPTVFLSLLLAYQAKRRARTRKKRVSLWFLIISPIRPGACTARVSIRFNNARKSRPWIFLRSDVTRIRYDGRAIVRTNQRGGFAKVNKKRRTSRAKLRNRCSVVKCKTLRRIESRIARNYAMEKEGGVL